MGKVTKAIPVDAQTQWAIREAQRITAKQDLVGGRTAINLDEFGAIKMSGDWDIAMPLGDIIMAEFVDENEFGEIKRDGIWIKQELTNKLWRVAKILKCGPGCAPYLVPGIHVMFPSDKGFPMVNFYGKKLIFLNEERIFAIVEKPKENNESGKNRK